MRDGLLCSETTVEVVDAFQYEDPVVGLTGLAQETVESASHGGNYTFSPHASRVYYNWGGLEVVLQ